MVNWCRAHEGTSEDGPRTGVWPKKLVATHREIQLNTKLFEWVSRVVGGLMKTPFYLIDIGVSRTDS